MPDAVFSAGDHLQVRFTRRGDRWEHAVEFRIGGDLVWQLKSDEGTSDDVWPPSPPFQSLDMHAHPDGRKFALLVGMAGASHWSASIETNSAHERIVFDVACRIKIEPRRLQSSYVSSHGGGPNVLPADEVIAQHLNQFPRVETIDLDSTNGDTRPIVETEGLRTLVRATSLSGPLPRTVRWKYVIAASDIERGTP